MKASDWQKVRGKQGLELSCTAPNRSWVASIHPWKCIPSLKFLFWEPNLESPLLVWLQPSLTNGKHPQEIWWQGENQRVYSLVLSYGITGWQWLWSAVQVLGIYHAASFWGYSTILQALQGLLPATVPQYPVFTSLKDTHILASLKSFQ